ncbi:riboflavin transporter MCH5 [Plectosphaerella cucumerina]|uniref:Riboflavin transporter MCH5 n=1 Tax=Plectosphaerella cucumerina TaxID=40658 RepID=A0A8K0TVD1_9PEZI|nr:riboflavin transporter MCH5 [Plectosphaerella cucumerina]
MRPATFQSTQEPPSTMSGENLRSIVQADTYPEGGWRAWSIVLGAWLALFSSLGLLSSIATFHTYLHSHQLANYSNGEIGWIFSVYTFVCFGGGVFIGPIFDKYGPRVLILVGTVCLVTSLMLLSFCHEYPQFLLTFGILGGVGTSLLFTPSIAVVGHWFSLRRGLATGIATTGGSMGGIAFPLLMNSLFDRVGWSRTISVIAMICLVLCGFSNLLLRSRLPPASNAKPRPDIRILREPAFALTTLGIFLLELSMFIPLTYISSYMVSEGFDTSFSYHILPILNAGSVLGRLLAGPWADRFGPFNVNILAVLLSIVACLGVWLPFGSTPQGIVVFAVIFGFASGSNISVGPVCIGRLCRTEEYGKYYATAYTSVSFACLVGIPAAGHIVAHNQGGYWVLIVFTGVVYVGSLAALWAAKVLRVGWGLFERF